MPEMTLTEKRQAQERADAEAKAASRKNATNPAPAPEKKGTGTFQVLPYANKPSLKDTSLRNKMQKQKIRSYQANPGEAVKFSDQD